MGRFRLNFLLKNFPQLCKNLIQKKKKNQQILDSGDYAKWLSICNLKSEVTIGLMNSFESDYQFRALNKIKKNNDLQQILKDFIALPEIGE